MANNSAKKQDDKAQQTVIQEIPVQRNLHAVMRDETHAAVVRKMELAKHYREEEKVPVTISPLYKPYFGNCMTVSINGISVYVKVDGKSYKVPKTFADEISSRIMAIDKINTKQDRLADVTNNIERTPGELELF